MTIWLLAILLMASLAGLGYRQGAIRVAFSFVAIVLGALLAVPVGRLLQPLLIAVGLKNVLLAHLLAPVIVFVVISIGFKIGAAAVHRKVDVFYKYKGGDLRLALWERLNARLGLCLGLLNGAAYIALLSFVIYSTSYVTYQVASEEGDPTWMRILNRLGKDLETSGLAKVGGALDSRRGWYDGADLLGLVYANPLLEARLARYPAFLSLAEQPEFKSLGADTDFLNARQKRAPAFELWNNPMIQGLANNPETLRSLWATISPDLLDLRQYLITGLSAKYDREQILGRWNFDVNHAMILYRRAKPNTSALEAQKIKRWMTAAFAQTSLVATPEHQFILKSLPQIRTPSAAVLQTVPGAPAPPPPPTQTVQGQWKGGNGQYQASFSGAGDVPLTVEGDRLRVNYDGTELVFTRET